MSDEALFQERVLKIAATGNHFALLTAPDGGFLRLEDGAGSVDDVADDGAMWLALSGDTYRHATTGRELNAKPRADGGLDLALDGHALGPDGKRSSVPAPFTADHGPEQLPSQYLQFFRDHGWVCLTCVVGPDLLDELQRVACTDGYADREVDRTAPQLCQSAAVAKTAAEPVSLWLTRQYMGLDEVTLGHAPAIVVLTKDDGKRNVQGWHSDYPYHWGIPAFAAVPRPSGATVLGVQRNVCVSEFTKVRGATAFKLGSHTLEQPPPEAWGRAGVHGRPGYRAEHGLPYTGPEADVIEAPAGKYDPLRCADLAPRRRQSHRPQACRDAAGDGAGLRGPQERHGRAVSAVRAECRLSRTRRTPTTGNQQPHGAPVSRRIPSPGHGWRRGTGDKLAPASPFDGP